MAYPKSRSLFIDEVDSDIVLQYNPITGQTFGCLLAGGALGSRRGPLSMLLYMVVGMIGMPVFAVSGSVLAEGQSLHVILPWSGSEGIVWSMASGGYIVGFIFASFSFSKKLNTDQKKQIFSQHEFFQIQESFFFLVSRPNNF